MDRRLQRMADFKAAFNDSVCREVVQHVRHRNSLLPIGKLPADLLQIIFNLVLFSSRGQRKRWFLSTLTTLQVVSWSWRDLIVRTPSFWAHVSSEDRKKFVSEALERSGQAPLHLTHTGIQGYGPTYSFLEMVLPHVHRWESVAIHLLDADVAAKYFSVSAHKIKTIMLSSLWNVSLSGADLATLEELRVVFSDAIGRGGVSCTRLRILDIEREVSLDMGALFNILTANPYLEVLRLHDVEFAKYPQPDPIPAPIPLDHLRHLTFTQSTEDPFSWGSVVIGYILQRIRFRSGIAFTPAT